MEGTIAASCVVILVWSSVWMTQKAITQDFSRWLELKRFDLFSWIDFEELGYQGLKEGEGEGEEEEGEGERRKNKWGEHTCSLSCLSCK